MNDQDFLNLIDENDIRVSILKKTHFSMGTSPYYSHQKGLAIDIYESLSLCNYYVHSPVEGKIIDIRELKAPPPKFHEGVNKEYLILIKSSQNPRIKFKILHVKPEIMIGQYIYRGDIIGQTIRNGYFAYWSSPHLHLEIRALADVNRAKGALPFKLNLTKSRKNIQSDLKHHGSDSIILRIKEMHPEFILATLPEDLYYKIGSISGVRGRLAHFNCILDGGIPLYKKGIIILDNEMKDTTKEHQVYLNEARVGIVQSKRAEIGLIDFFENLTIKINQTKIRGLSLFLSGNEPYIKLIPYEINQFSFKKDSIQKLYICNGS